MARRTTSVPAAACSTSPPTIRRQAATSTRPRPAASRATSRPAASSRAAKASPTGKAPSTTSPRPAVSAGPATVYETAHTTRYQSDEISYQPAGPCSRYRSGRHDLRLHLQRPGHRHGNDDTATRFHDPARFRGGGPEHRRLQQLRASRLVQGRRRLDQLHRLRSGHRRGGRADPGRQLRATTALMLIPIGKSLLTLSLGLCHFRQEPRHQLRRRFPGPDHLGEGSRRRRHLHRLQRRDSDRDRRQWHGHHPQRDPHLPRLVPGQCGQLSDHWPDLSLPRVVSANHAGYTRDAQLRMDRGGRECLAGHDRRLQRHYLHHSARKRAPQRRQYAVIQSLSRSITNGQGQVVESDEYSSLPNITYSGKFALFGHGRAPIYVATKYGFDPTGNHRATFDPSGTVSAAFQNWLGQDTANYKGQIVAAGDLGIPPPALPGPSATSCPTALGFTGWALRYLCAFWFGHERYDYSITDQGGCSAWPLYYDDPRPCRCRRLVLLGTVSVSSTTSVPGGNPRRYAAFRRLPHGANLCRDLRRRWQPDRNGPVRR